MSHILGFTGDRDVGQEGIELAQQEWLGGHPGSRRVIINRRGDVVEDVEAIRAPQAGRDLALAIDTRLQHIAFRELKAAVEANKAKAGGLVILDVRSGEILALANWPTFNPNARNGVARERMRNRALTDVFEPGSTLKPFTIAAALETGRVRPDTVIQTAPGTLTIGPATIHDAHVHGALTVEQVIQKSSNVGAAKIALSLPAETMWHTLSEAGFGAAPKTGFPGEVGGRLLPPKTWRPIEQATIAYGHGISVNLVQLARAYTVFATDGELSPRRCSKRADRSRAAGVVAPHRARRAPHARARGAAGRHRPKAQVPGYRVAGKTGTAHSWKGVPTPTSSSRRSSASAPVSALAAFVVAVMIDEPGAASTTAATSPRRRRAAVMAARRECLRGRTTRPSTAILPPPAAASTRT